VHSIHFFSASSFSFWSNAFHVAKILLFSKAKVVHSFNQPVFSSASAIAFIHSSQILLFRKYNIDHSLSQPVFANAAAISFAHSSQI
jgi:hypothetical protein